MTAVVAPTCSVDGCGRRRDARGLCTTHWMRAKRGASLTAPVRPVGQVGCCMAGCENPHESLGLCKAHYERRRDGLAAPCSTAECGRPGSRSGMCSAHYQRSRRGADMDAPIRVTIADPREAMAAYVAPARDGCIEWTGGRNAGGYGYFRDGLAHRAAWEFANGPITPGMHVLHRCDNPPCLNPDHLFLGTDQDNHDDRRSKGRPTGAAAARSIRTSWGSDREPQRVPKA